MLFTSTCKQQAGVILKLMKKKPQKFRSHCPINYVQEIFGDKWSLLIVRDLMFKKKKYYGEFLKSEEKISTNILADRLVKLEKNKIISKKQDAHHHSKYIYALTQKGKDLLPMLLEMLDWSAIYDDDKSDAPPLFIRRLKKNRASLIKELRANMENK